MDKINKNCIHHLLVLNRYFQILCVGHYPKEIIQIIITLHYKLFKIKIKCGEVHFMILLDGDLYSWGKNESGQLGLGHYEHSPNPKKVELSNVIKISCGICHSMALTKEGEVYVWGSSTRGQLGLGHIHSRSSPCCVRINHLSDGESISAISAKGCHSMALTNFGNVYVWGNNMSGQLGLDCEDDVRHPKKLDLVNLMKVPSGVPPIIKKISCGNSHSVALSNSGLFFVWGNYEQPIWDEFGQKYNPGSLNIKDIICGSYYTVVMTKEKEIYANGFYKSNYNIKINLPQKIDFSDAKKISCGQSHFMILANSGEVYAQGGNDFGQLGLDHNSNACSLQKLNLSNIKKIACGDVVSFAITEMNNIYVWGKGYGNTPFKFTF
jgi:alpha-tubulin suppressor-like RCC1 family protein